MMIKAKFLRAEVVAGSRPRHFEAGKGYWLTDDAFRFWLDRGVVEPAPADLPSENAPFHVLRAGRALFHVNGPDHVRVTREPVDFDSAELLLAKASERWLAEQAGESEGGDGGTGDGGAGGDPSPPPSPQGGEGAPVAIPGDWREMLAEPMKALAEAISGQPVRTKAEAEPIIAAEVERREALVVRGSTELTMRQAHHDGAEDEGGAVDDAGAADGGAGGDPSPRPSPQGGEGEGA